MGRWIKKTNGHACRRPNSGRKGVGSEWRCRCGQAWRIAGKRWSPSGATLTTTWARIARPEGTSD